MNITGSSEIAGERRHRTPLFLAIETQQIALREAKLICLERETASHLQAIILESKNHQSKIQNSHHFISQPAPAIES